MIRHSGIGVVLRALLRHWADHPPPFHMLLCGDPWTIAPSVPPGLDARMVAWPRRVYSLSSAVLAPRLRKIAAWYSPHYATCLAGRWPLVCHVQDILHITHPTRRGTALYKAVYLEALRRRAAYVLTTSRHVKVQLQTLHRFEPSRVLRTGLGPGIAEMGSDDATPPLPEELIGKPYLLAVGIYKSHKNWEFLFERLATTGITDLPIVCLGAGRDRKRLIELARSKGMTGRMYALPHLEDSDMAVVYRHATALLFPSVAEGFGLPILEAMTLGTPVLIADRSPMKEIANGGAYTFDPDHAITFDAALKELLGDEGKRQRLIQDAHEKARVYTWARTATVVEDAIQRAIDERAKADLAR